jgi:hypothetical protein
LVAGQKATDGEDPLETGMNEESLRNSVLNRRIPKDGRLHPLVLEVARREDNASLSALISSHMVLDTQNNFYFYFTSPDKPFPIRTSISSRAGKAMQGNRTVLF